MTFAVFVNLGLSGMEDEEADELHAAAAKTVLQTPNLFRFDVINLKEEEYSHVWKKFFAHPAAAMLHTVSLRSFFPPTDLLAAVSKHQKQLLSLEHLVDFSACDKPKLKPLPHLISLLYLEKNMTNLMVLLAACPNQTLTTLLVQCCTLDDKPDRMRQLLTHTNIVNVNMLSIYCKRGVRTEEECAVGFSALKHLKYFRLYQLNEKQLKAMLSQLHVCATLQTVDIGLSQHTPANWKHDMTVAALKQLLASTTAPNLRVEYEMRAADDGLLQAMFTEAERQRIQFNVE
jgi:hypothetical protein